MSRKTAEQRFRVWAKSRPGDFGNLDYALRDPESVASIALAAYRAGRRDQGKERKHTAAGKPESEVTK